MSTAVLCAPFDPITAEELAYAADLLKQPGVSSVILAVENDGVLDPAERLKLAERAARPYRRMFCAYASDVSGTRLSEELIDSERIVREGAFRKAAPGIVKILAESTMYLDAVLDAQCKPRRAVHSRSVADLCRRLAEIHGIDPVKAWRAGIMHDLTKAWPDEKSRALLEIYAPDKTEYPSPVWHSFTCPVFLKTVMGIDDHELLQAIAQHTLGDCTGTLSKILYIADKIEPTRGYDVSRETELAEKDLDAAFELVYKEAEQYRERRMDG